MALTLLGSQPTRQPAHGVVRRVGHETTTDNEGLNPDHDRRRRFSSNSLTTIKAAMAVGIGNTLLLFQGLSSISPKLSAEASLPSPPSSPISPKRQEQEEQDSSMGLRSSKPSRKSMSPTSPTSKKGRFKPEYQLSVVCSTCAITSRKCSTADDINANGGSSLAYQDGNSYFGPRLLTPWQLQIDCCGWSPNRDAGLRAVEKCMRNAETSNKPMCVDDLLGELEEEGVKYASSVAKKSYVPRGEIQQPQQQQPYHQQYHQQHQPQYHQHQYQQRSSRSRGRTPESWYY